MLELIISDVPTEKVANLDRIMADMHMQVDENYDKIRNNYKASIKRKECLTLTIKNAKKYENLLAEIGYKTIAVWQEKDAVYFVLHESVIKKSKVNSYRPTPSIEYYKLSNTLDALAL